MRHAGGWGQWVGYLLHCLPGPVACQGWEVARQPPGSRGALCHHSHKLVTQCNCTARSAKRPRLNPLVLFYLSSFLPFSYLPLPCLPFSVSVHRICCHAWKKKSTNIGIFHLFCLLTLQSSVLFDLCWESKFMYSKLQNRAFFSLPLPGKMSWPCLLLNVNARLKGKLATNKNLFSLIPEFKDLI